MKRVVVVASGETERHALPSLLGHLLSENISVGPVLFPPRNGSMSADTVKKIVQASYWSADPKPDKFVVLVDADGGDPLRTAAELESRVSGKCNVPTPILVTAAKWHLEAWFFADSAGLRAYLGRDLGKIDTTRSDDIQNPKLHLKDLLGHRLYTRFIAGEIASTLSASRIVETSPSFARLQAIVRNGPATPG